MNIYSKYIGYYKTEKRLKEFIKKKKCPVCEIMLESKYHTDCSFLQDIHTIKLLLPKQKHFTMK